MNAFIIGAGFTRSTFPAAPLNAGLLETLAERATNSSAATLRERYKTDDIEIALTKLDMEIAASQNVGGPSVDDSRALRRRIESELGQYFSSFVACEALLARAPWLAQFADDVLSQGDVVISLNYDCVLEGSLDCREKWSPKGGYGSLFVQPLIEAEEYPESPVTVLKIHGSANFVIAPYWDKHDANALNFIFDEHFFPRSAKNTHFGYGGGTGRNYLIAPSYVKMPTVEIAYLMIDALNASTCAKNLVLIGTALRPEDGFLTVLLTNFLRQPSWRARRVFIVDPAADTISHRLKTYWGVDVSGQIVPIQGSFEASVPRLVEQMSGTSGSE